ncbi:MAG: hypothetical protein VW877_15485, partial [Pseudomonadaceae bacterium]
MAAVDAFEQGTKSALLAWSGKTEYGEGQCRDDHQQRSPKQQAAGTGQHGGKKEGSSRNPGKDRNKNAGLR